MKTITFYILLTLIFINCTLTPSRKLIPKGEFEPEVALNALIGDAREGFPLVPNLNVGACYGVTDKFNIGLAINPLTLLVEGIVMAEPYAVIGIMHQKSVRFTLNSHLSFPLFISLSQKEIKFFPLLGITPIYSYNSWRWYTTCELVFDSKTYTNGIDVHYNFRFGTCFSIQKWFSLIFEWGIVNINRPSVLTNDDFGQPIISIGCTYNYLKRKKCKID